MSIKDAVEQALAENKNLAESIEELKAFHDKMVSLGVAKKQEYDIARPGDKSVLDFLSLQRENFGS